MFNDVEPRGTVCSLRGAAGVVEIGFTLCLDKNLMMHSSQGVSSNCCREEEFSEWTRGF